MTQIIPSISELRQAIESRDAKRLKSFYAPDAVLTIVDNDNPPSRPRVIRGAMDIGAFLDDVCSRDMTHTLDMGISDRNGMAYVQGCRYSDGTRVMSSNMAELGPHGIVKHTVVQAWDS